MGEGGLIQVLKRDSNVIGVEIGLVPLKVGGSLLTMAILNQSHMDWALLYLMSFGFYWRQHRMLPSAVGREIGIGVAIRQPKGSFDQVVCGYQPKMYLSNVGREKNCNNKRGKKASGPTGPVCLLHEPRNSHPPCTAYWFF